MDVFSAIRELIEERNRLDRLLAALESRQRALRGEPEPKRRGRKSMGHDERKQVSERMRRYWEQRRTAKQAAYASNEGSGYQSAAQSAEAAGADVRMAS